MKENCAYQGISLIIKATSLLSNVAGKLLCITALAVPYANINDLDVFKQIEIEEHPSILMSFLI